MALRPLLTVVLLLTVAGGPAAAAVDLRNVLNEYSLTSWGTKDGLPSSEVLAIAQDADGFLWLGTDGGLVRFDGTRFAVQAGPPTGRSVRALLVTRAGELWAGLGGSGGVLRYRRAAPGEFALVAAPPTSDGLGTGAVRALAEDRDGTVWLGHLGGLFRYADGRWMPWQAEGLRHEEIHALLVDARGRLIVGTRHGVRMAVHADRNVFTTLDRTDPRDEAVHGVSVDAEGRVWRTDGVHGFQGRVTDRHPIRPAEIARGSRLLHDRAGHLWVGTGGQGLWRVSQRADGGVVVEQSTVTTGLLGNGVVSVYEDRDGNVWAGTLDGLNRLTRFVATPVQGLGLVSGLEVSPQGIWVMTAESLPACSRAAARSTGRSWPTTATSEPSTRTRRAGCGCRPAIACTGSTSVAATTRRRWRAASARWRCWRRTAAAGCGCTTPRSACTDRRVQAPPHASRIAFSGHA